MERKLIDSTVNEHRKEIIDFIYHLIEIHTVNAPPYGFEKDGQDYFKDACERIGLDIDTFTPEQIEGYEDNKAFLKGRDYKDRYNVVGKWKGSAQGKSLLLSGHMDVVPEYPTPWEKCQPFNPRIINGRIYGRGAADMKAAVGAAYMALKLLKETGYQPKGDVIIESVVDEEFASGNGTIASRLRGHNADFAILMEATGLKVCPANIGALLYKLTIHGVSGMPFGGKAVSNPIYLSSYVISLIKEYEEKINRTAKKPGLWEAQQNKLNIILSKISSGDTKEHGQLTTPTDLWMEVIIQTYPGEKEEDVTEDFKAFIYDGLNNKYGIKQEQIDIEQEYHYVEPCAISRENEGVQLLSRSLENINGKSSNVEGSVLSCDLFAFEKYGKTPAVIFGPMGDNFHAADEWVDIDSIMTFIKTLMTMITDWCK